MGDTDASPNRSPRVAVLGAGVSGLVLARALQRHGIQPVVYEQSHKVGGVWRATTHAQGVQVPFQFYSLPEYPWPAQLKASFSSSGLPPAHAVQTYLEDYAAHFSLLPYVHFNTKVILIERPGGTASKLQVHSVSSGREGTELFDSVVVATGFCHSARSINAQGRQLYEHPVLHAHQLTTQALDLAKDQHVIVIGSGKSAVDAAVAASEVAASVTNVFRTAHWQVPLKILGLVPMQFVAYTRLGIALLPDPYYNITGLWAAWHTLLKPVKWAIWRAMEIILPLQQGLPKQMIPEDAIEKDLFGVAILENADLMPAVHSGKIRPVKGEIQEWTKNGVRLQDGTELRADLVVQGLGYDKPYTYFSPALLKSLDVGPDGLHLYRNIAAHNVPGVYFVGSESVSYNAPLSAALQSEWLARLLAGKFALPSSGEMAESVATGQAWRERWITSTNQRAGKTYLFQTNYIDELLTDIGETPQRKGWGLLRELWSPYTMDDYAGVVEPH